MVHKGQKFQRVGARDVWEVLGPRPRHDGEWYNGKQHGHFISTGISGECLPQVWDKGVRVDAFNDRA